MARPMCSEIECLEEGRSLRRILAGPFEIEAWLCSGHLERFDAVNGTA